MDPGMALRDDFSNYSLALAVLLAPMASVFPLLEIVITPADPDLPGTSLEGLVMVCHMSEGLLHGI